MTGDSSAATPAQENTITIPHRIRTLSREQKDSFARQLQPYQQEVAACLLDIRHQLDPRLQEKHPLMAGKPYPLGRCREIRNAVLNQLRLQLNNNHLIKSPILEKIRLFLQQGGNLGKIWGSLRDAYFQNALQLGDWYVDVANDTVDPKKPKIEILPMTESGFKHILDYEHFCRIAAPYWQVKIYANTVFPGLAPLLPLICVNRSGWGWLAPAYDEMIELSRQRRFHPPEKILRALPPPPESIQLRLLKAASSLELEILALEGDSIAACQQARESGAMHSETFRQQRLEAYVQLHKKMQENRSPG